MTEEKQESTALSKSLAVIRIRGPVRVRGVVEDTMKRLNLFTRNSCVVVPKTPGVLGMVMKAKDYVTYGEIDDETLKLLKEKRGKKAKESGEEVAKKFFALHPPRGGFERKGIKKSFNVGGALGYRGRKINDLIKRMV